MGITFIITGLMAIGFMSFGGMLTGGDEEGEVGTETATKVDQIENDENEDDLANNTKVIE